MVFWFSSFILSPAAGCRAPPDPQPGLFSSEPASPHSLACQIHLAQNSNEITLDELIKQKQERRELTTVTRIRPSFITVLVNPFPIVADSSAGVYVSVWKVVIPILECERTVVRPFPGVSEEADPKRFRLDHRSDLCILIRGLHDGQIPVGRPAVILSVYPIGYSRARNKPGDSRLSYI